MDYILLSEEGKKQFYDKLEQIKEKTTKNGNELSKSFNDYVGDGWHDNPLYEEAMRKNRMIDEELKKMLNEEKQIKLIDEDYGDKFVNINDTIKIEFIYSDDESEAEIIKLTGKYIPNTELEIVEITLNSPIGKAILGKKIGKECFYTVDNNKVKLRIIEKVNL